MVVGIGGFRDLGDPYDPRRELGGVPQSAEIAGLPGDDREIARTVDGKLVYYSPEKGVSIEAVPRGRRFDAGKRTENERLVAAEIDQMRMEEAIASEDPEVARRFFSDTYGQGELDVRVTSRAAELAAAMPEIGPFGALKIATAEYRAGSPTARRFSRNVNRRIAQETVDKIGQMGEIRPELALFNAIENEKAAQGSSDAGTADISTSDQELLNALAKRDAGTMSPAEMAATVMALDERGRAKVRAFMKKSEPFTQISGKESDDLNAESGRNRSIPRQSRRNPLNKEPVTVKVDEGYRVPVLIAPADQARRGGKSLGFKFMRDQAGDFVYQPTSVKVPGEKSAATGFNKKQYDTRNMMVAMLDPSVELDSSLGYVFNREAEQQSSDSERVGKNMNVPTGERQPYYGVNEGESGSEVPGFPAGSDPASVRIGQNMTLGEAVQDIAMRNRTPIRTYRIGIDVAEKISEAGRPYYKLLNADGSESSQPISALKNQPQGFYEQGLVEIRMGKGEITDEGMRELNDLISAVVPAVDPENRVFVKEPMNKEGEVVFGPARQAADYVAVVNNPMQDPVVNRMQNALLDQYIDGELFKAGRGVQDPERNPTYDIISALSAGRSLPPQDIEREVAELIGKGDTSDVNDVIVDLRKATGANPEVQRLRQKYRDVPGANPKSFVDYAEAFAGSDSEPSSADMRKTRAQFRGLASVASQAEVDEAMGGGRAAEDRPVDFATRRQVARLEQMAKDNAQANDSPLNAPSAPDEFARTKIDKIKQVLRNFAR